MDGNPRGDQQTSLDSTNLPAPTARRPPPKTVTCIVPVWGYTFTRQFLEIGLRTMLAPGNVPALAAALPCRFIILTSAEDEPFLRLHQSFRALSAVCPVELRLIDHLITGTNHSTTITLAYAEAIRATGADMLDTCFFLLVSDYIVADGSFGNMLARMMAGASALQVGNFQVSLEDALPWLEEQLGATPGSVALRPRELLRWAFSHLHPATVANTVNYPLSKNIHTNRLFWRVDGETLLGRFYLMHMLCIRPELTDFVIASSCDYSFIQEMCPSDNVEIITDSDEYLVVEMQPREHEANFLRHGRLRPRPLARTLSRWTTARHRRNAGHSVLFHAGEIPRALVERTEREAEEFLAAVRGAMRREPKPYRNHPYWRGAIAAFHEAKGKKLSLEEWRLVLGLSNPSDTESRLHIWMMDKVRFFLFGQPPNVRFWHPRFPDFRFVLNRLQRFLDDPRQRLLLVSDIPTIFTASLIDGGERVMRLRQTPFLQIPAETYEPLFGNFDACLVEVTEAEMRRCDEIIDRVAPMMRPGATVIVVVYNHRERDIAGFSRSIGTHAPRLLRPAATATGIYFIPATWGRWTLLRTMVRIAQRANSNPVIGIPVLFATGGFLVLGAMMSNLLQRQSRPALRPGGLATSFVMELRIEGGTAHDAYKYSANRTIRQRQRRRFGISEQVAATGRTPASADGTREPQYNRSLDLKDKFGLTTLGLMTNQVYHDDPRRLAILLARYKFVAKMLSGKEFVAEIGCGDAFGTRLVMQEVNKVVGYDFDPVFIQDIRARQDPRWPLETHVHDIVFDTLPHKHDGIYSLDVIEHVARADEHAFLSNLRGSLTDNGVLIIGTPSLESQNYASPQSVFGHINCKSGVELKVLLEKYFEHVFLFSMNDEVVHTGFYPMAHYLLAICCGKI
jgi:2-polyprenyl-3-methyl-5-hydroxy-6-metoxy-1,4-benzoquinol methylase